MGHADVQTTLRYVDIGEQQKRDAIAAVFGCWAGSGQQNDAAGAAVT